jgi:hypothetical protein
MIRTLRTLGVAFVAILALSAIAASSASATGKVTCVATSGSPYPCTLTGESAIGNDTFKTEGGTVECKAHFHANITEAVSSLTVTPKYTNCRAFGFLEATVHMNGCDYLFTTPTNIGTDLWTSGSTTTEGTATHLLCPTEKTIEITAATCRIEIHPQTLHGHLVINNKTTPAGDGGINVQATYEKITYTVVQDGFGCPFNGLGTKHDASYIQHNPVPINVSGKDVHVG